MSVENLPAINATLNACATLCLLGGWIAIRRRGDRALHRNLMIAALACSALFLSCYLYYHYHAGAMTRYERADFTRYVYYFILATHVPLATLMVPFILAAVWFAFRGDFRLHTRITRYLWPVWMYVSVTGVLVYLMLYQLQ
jgi:uncharacterized membrane protein YozB (DUF420 family)